jgi:type IV secretion system protein VirD4
VNRTRPDQNQTEEVATTVAVVLVGVALGLAGLHWLIGNLAAMLGRQRLLHANLVDAAVAVKHLGNHLDDPRLAWTEPARSNLPGAVVYWVATAIVVVAALAAAVAAFQLVGRHRH